MDSLEQSRNVVMLVSCNSLTSQSSSYEIGLALSHARHPARLNVVPVLLEGVDTAALPGPLRSVQAIDVARTTESITDAINRALAPSVQRDKTIALK